MDLNTALMESINSMSEYFVAANTRTSFTDLAESSNNSFGPLNNNSNNINSTEAGNSSNNLNNQAHTFGNSSLLNVKRELGSPTPADHLSNISPVPNHINNSNNNSNNINNINNINSNSTTNTIQRSLDSCPSLESSPLQHSSSKFRNHINQNQSRTSPYKNDHHSSSLQAHQLSQPIRSQIPIHCLIEQVDTCADVPSYQPTLTDNDLFKTANPTDSTKASTSNHDLSILNSSTNGNHSSHLHQSKLALESVTNCNRTNTDLSHLNNSSLFDDDPVDDLDCIHSSLDHIGSDSPLSIHPPSTQDVHSIGKNGYQRTSTFCNEPPDVHTSRSCFNADSQSFQSFKETYVIVASNTLYIDLVRTVMQQLGYSPMDQINAKAKLQVRNWQPIPMDQVSEDKAATVGEILGDLSSFVTLRIKIYSNAVNHGPTEWTETMIRQIVLALTQNMSQLTLSKLCNISQPLISSIVRGGKKLGRRKCQEFGQWYLNYIQSADTRPPATVNEGSSGSGGGARLVFDKTREIPRLKAWFANNTKPSEELLEEYSRLMNEDALRKDRPQVTAKALKNWWKNERQKLGIRQREIRGRPKLKQID